MSNNVSSSQEFVDRYDDIYRQFIELKNDYEKLYYGRDLSELNRLKEHMENTKNRAFENAEGSDFTEHRKLMDQFKNDPSDGKMWRLQHERLNHSSDPADKALQTFLYDYFDGKDYRLEKQGNVSDLVEKTLLHSLYYSVSIRKAAEHIAKEYNVNKGTLRNEVSKASKWMKMYEESEK